MGILALLLSNFAENVNKLVPFLHCSSFPFLPLIYLNHFLSLWKDEGYLIANKMCQIPIQLIMQLTFCSVLQLQRFIWKWIKRDFCPLGKIWTITYSDKLTIAVPLNKLIIILRFQEYVNCTETNTKGRGSAIMRSLFGFFYCTQLDQKLDNNLDKVDS